MQSSASLVRWGIMGTGRIARDFATGLSLVPDAAVVAVGSRAVGTAAAFADRFGIPHRHGSYATLAEDPDVDVVYVATPHTLHCDCTLLALTAGKAVLCEKPFAINAAQAETMIAAARRQGLFLMEAMWTRFVPAMAKIRKLLAAGAIGDIRMVTADLGWRAPFYPAHRLFNPALGGGALLDAGVYPLSLASMVLGPPARVTAMAHLGESGVDEQAAMILGYGSGRLAVLSAAIRTTTPHVATIMGTDGMIDLHHDWHKPTAFTLRPAGGAPRRYECPPTGAGYMHEAAEVVRCLRNGLLESPVLPLDETLIIMRTMDEIRAQWGLRYPEDRL